MPDARLRRGWTMAILLLAGALAACGGEKQQQQQAPAGPKVRGGTVVVGMQADFGPLNPIVNTDQYTDELIKYGLYTPLIQFDAKLQPVPYLAQSWEMTGDTGVVFHLRHDVHWHDTRPVTAQDVKFTFDLAKNPATASMLAESYLSKVDRAQVIDNWTIRFHFSQPHAQAIQDFWWAPVPQHILAGVPPAQMRDADFNRHPVGSGPYHFNMWQANDRLVVERELNFPKELGGPPALDRVVFRIIPEPATLVAELMSGGIQIDVPMEPEQVVNVKNNPALQLMAFPGRTVYFIAWNNKRPPFNDERVRRAMTLGIDRAQITETLLRGYGQPAVSPLPPWSPLSPNVKPLPFDRAQAMQLLADAGYTIKGNARVVTNAAGQPIHITLITADRPFTASVAQVVQAMLHNIGVQVDVRPMEFQTFLAQYKSRDFDAALANWVMDSFQVGSAPFALFSSTLASVPGSSNRAGVASPKLDQLMARAASETSERAARGDWKDFVEELQTEQPFTFLFWWAEMSGVDRRVHGVVMDPRGQLQSMKDWWLTGGRLR